MKNILKCLVLSMTVLGLAACTDNDLDDMQGTYDNIAHYNFTSATVEPTVKLHKGVKALNVSLTDNSGNTATLSFGSKEWILPSGSYNGTATVSTSGNLSGTVGGQTISSGSMDVNTLDSTYYFNGLVTLADGSQSVVNYHGPLSFVIGEDDPEASGFTLTMTSAPVMIFDMTTYQMKVIDGVMKYTFAISDETGKQVAEINAINNSGKTITDLAGTYTVASSAQAAMTIDAGYCVPAYNMAGGTYYTDDNGFKYYVGGGTVTIKLDHDSDGNALYSFIGEGISTIDESGNAGEGSFKITYVSEASSNN